MFQLSFCDLLTLDLHSFFIFIHQIAKVGVRFAVGVTVLQEVGRGLGLSRAEVGCRLGVSAVKIKVVFS